MHKSEFFQNHIGHFILSQMMLAIKKTKLMTIGTAINFRTDSEVTA